MTLQRPFLKWAGGKYRLLNIILSHLPDGKRLIEPFAGSGALFINTNYSRYLINDLNTDLINLYRHLKKHGDSFIQDAAQYFTPKHNCKDTYYALRKTFNASQDSYEKSLLFIYLNRHGYNGLCRYSLRTGFNVPFGRYVKPAFPEAHLQHFYRKIKKARLSAKDYQTIFAQAQSGDVIYCDPPYVTNHDSSAFKYFGNAFTHDDQAMLATLAESAQKKGITTLISNHDTPLTRALYKKATLESFEIYRPISRSPDNRRTVSELIACYGA